MKHPGTDDKQGAVHCVQQGFCLVEEQAFLLQTVVYPIQEKLARGVTRGGGRSSKQPYSSMRRVAVFAVNQPRALHRVSEAPQARKLCLSPLKREGWSVYKFARYFT